MNGDGNPEAPSAAAVAVAGDQLDPKVAPQNSRSMYLVLTNISKRSNVRSLLLTAAAFGCRAIFVVGQKQFDWSPEGQDIPGQLEDHIVAQMPIIHFSRWEECVYYLKTHHILLVGVEIHPDSQNIDTFEHDGNVAFLMGNEGQGLHEKHMASCDAFVMISQYGGGTASLNVYVAASIVLHRYHERLREQR